MHGISKVFLEVLQSVNQRAIKVICTLWENERFLPDLEKKDQLIGVIRVLAGGGVVNADKTALQFSTPSPLNPSQGYTPQSTYRARGETGGVYLPSQLVQSTEYTE